MSFARKLSALGLRPLVQGASLTVGVIAGEAVGHAVANLLSQQLSDEGHRLERALQTAHEQAWKTIELALAGDSFWERCKARLKSGLDRDFRDQIRTFLDSIPPNQLPSNKGEFRSQCLLELRAARQADVLFANPGSPEDWSGDLDAFTRFSDPQQLLRAEQRLVQSAGEELQQAGYPALAQLLDLGQPSLLVLALRYYLRRRIEEDEKLARGLAFNQLEGLHAGQEEGFAALEQLLSEQGARVEDLLGEVQAVVVETHAAVLDVRQELQRQGEQNRALYEAVLELQRRLDLAQPEVRPRDSLSIRNDAERRMVKEVVARYRALPEQKREQLPALLNALGQLQLAAGAFEAAEQDFSTVATLVQDPAARAEAHHNAYRAALETRDWDKALRELTEAIRLQPKRFAPFPLDRYQSQRILGAGGFGVVFLCHDRQLRSPVVVKTLLDDDLERGVDQLFAEARALRQLDHPGIVQLQDCGYADPSRRARPYLVMEYFDGVTLDAYVARNGTLGPRRMLRLARQMADALLAAHEKGILHRDIKPGNLLVRDTESGLEAQLIDFGLAMKQTALKKSTQKSSTLLGTSIAGTLDYAAPEQLGKLPGVKVGPPADVFGFGKTLCFALFGTTQPVLRHWQSIPEPVAEFLGRCLAEAPTERPEDFATVLRCLKKIDLTIPRSEGNSIIPVADPDPLPSPPVRRPRRRVVEEPESTGMPYRGYILGGAVALALFLVLLGLAMARTSQSPHEATPALSAELEWGHPNPPPARGTRQIFPPPMPSASLTSRAIYLSDLREEATSEFPAGWAFGKAGDLRDPLNGRIRLGGVESPHGLSTHPRSGESAWVRYTIEPSVTFWSVVGIADSSTGVSSDLTFSVHGDGRQLWQSKSLRETGSFDICQVRVLGVKQLELRVHGPSGSHNQCHAVWFEPLLVPERSPSKTKPVTPPARLPSPGERGNKVYLTDLKDLDVRGGQTWLGKDGKIPRGSPITVNGKRAPKGLGQNPFATEAASVKYALNGKYVLLETEVALDDSTRNSPVDFVFSVHGDGRELFRSKSLDKGQSQPCQVDVTGVRMLELRVEGRNPSATAVWIDPAVYERKSR